MWPEAGVAAAAFAVRLGFDPDFAPFTFMRDGQPAGLALDVVMMAAAMSGGGVQAVPVALASRQALLTGGDLDGWACMAILEERREQFVFTLPFVRTGGGLFRPSRNRERGCPGVARIATPAAGPLVRAAAAAHPDAHVVQVDGGYRETFIATLEGQAEAAALNFHAGAFLAAQWYPDMFDAPMRMFAPVGLAVAVRRSLADAEDRWVRRFDADLVAVAEQGKLADVCARWGFGEESVPDELRPGR